VIQWARQKAACGNKHNPEGDVGKMGRPPAAMEKIDKAELKKLMQFHPSEKEAADWFDVSLSSLERFIKKEFQCTFDEFRDKGFVRTKISIKRKQIEMALGGDRVMLIWCGKQYCGQSEKVMQVEESEAEFV
jgi:hypothetical protein